jgi:hypothetical protein
MQQKICLKKFYINSTLKRSTNFIQQMWKSFWLREVHQKISIGKNAPKIPIAKNVKNT